MLPRLGEIFFLAIFAAIIGMGPRLMNQDGDLGRHLTLGDQIIESRSIPTEDIFSFTKTGDSLTPHEWLADVIFALAHRLTGLDGVVWVTALILAVTSLLIYRYSVQLSSFSMVALVLGLLGAAAASVHWLTRPHIFTILFSVIWAGELEKMRLGIRKSWWIFPVSMLLWVNLHGAFIAGLLIWACFYVGELVDTGLRWSDSLNMLLAGVSSFLVTLINPDGIGIWKTGFGFLGNRYLVSHTAEYLPPDFQNSAFWPFMGLIFVSMIILGFKKRKMSAAQIFLISGWTIMALYSARNIPLYAAVAIPFLSAEATAILKDWQETPLVKTLISFQHRFSAAEKEIKGGFWGIACVVLVLILFMSGSSLDFASEGNRFQPDVFPVEAADWIEGNHLNGNGFNHFPWGGYLLYRFWPDQLVFIDGQTDFYGEELTREYEIVITIGENWEDVFNKYDIEWTLIPAGSDLAEILTYDPDWSLIYFDKTSVIFSRDIK